jgi:hypothetical protein
MLKFTPPGGVNFHHVIKNLHRQRGVKHQNAKIYTACGVNFNHVIQNLHRHKGMNQQNLRIYTA